MTHCLSHKQVLRYTCPMCHVLFSVCSQRSFSKHRAAIEKEYGQVSKHDLF